MLKKYYRQNPPHGVQLTHMQHEKSGVVDTCSVKTRATIEVHHFFSEVSSTWELKTCLDPKNDLEKTKLHRTKIRMA